MKIDEYVTIKELADRFDESILVISLLLRCSEFAPYVTFHKNIEYSSFYITVESLAMLKRYLNKR